jgi:Plasmid stabilization system protein
MGEIKWTEKASENLLAIFDYIASDSKVYASRFIKSLIEAAGKLETMPYCGRIVPELENYGFREVLYRDYRIVYRILKNNADVEILAVIHGAREMKPLLAQDWELN